jgi:GxxExxY protein
MKNNDISFSRKFEMLIYYIEQHIGTRREYFLIKELISVELNTLIQLEDLHLTQAINYLEAYNLGVDLLINFGTKSLEFNA